MSRSTQQQIESLIEVISTTEPHYIYTRRAAAQALLDLLNFQIDMQQITAEEAAERECIWHTMRERFSEQLGGEL